MYHSIKFKRTDSFYENERWYDTWYDWNLIPVSRPVISPPECKTHYVDVPGSNGKLDLSTALTGYPLYENRTGSIEFIVMNKEIELVQGSFTNDYWIRGDVNGNGMLEMVETTDSGDDVVLKSADALLAERLSADLLDCSAESREEITQRVYTESYDAHDATCGYFQTKSLAAAARSIASAAAGGFFLPAGTYGWANRFSEIQNVLHGQKIKMILEDDPYYYYEGVVWVSEWTSGSKVSCVTIDYDLYPYKKERYSSLEYSDWEWDAFNLERGFIRDYSRFDVTETYDLYIYGGVEPITPKIYFTPEIEYVGVTNNTAYTFYCVAAVKISGTSDYTVVGNSYTGILQTNSRTILLSDTTSVPIATDKGLFAFTLEDGAGTAGVSTGQKAYWVIRSSGINVRSGPSTSYSKLGVLSYGTRVYGVMESNNWLKFDYNGSTGYSAGLFNGNDVFSDTNPDDNEEEESPVGSDFATWTTMTVCHGDEEANDPVYTLNYGENIFSDLKIGMFNKVKLTFRGRGKIQVDYRGGVL